MNTALEDWSASTNISRDPLTNKLTNAHSNLGKPGQRIQKAYDRFFGVASEGNYLKTQPTQRSDQFVLNPSGCVQKFANNAFGGLLLVHIGND